MSTFSELQRKLSEKKFEKAIIDRLVEYLDETFLIPDSNKRMILLTDDKLPVPEESFDAIIHLLNGLQGKAQEEIHKILSSKLETPATPKE